MLDFHRLATSVHKWWFWWKRCRPSRVFYPVITKPDSLILGLHQQTLATINSSITQISRRVLQFLNTTPQLVILLGHLLKRPPNIRVLCHMFSTSITVSSPPHGVFAVNTRTH